VASRGRPSAPERPLSPRPVPPAGAAGPAAGGVTGAVLCGGHSRRMGADKALLPLDGRRLIDYPLEALRPVAGRILLACGPRPRYAELALETVLDAFPDGGPLAGLLAALEACRGEWLVLVACDMPRVEPRVLRALLEEAARSDLDVCLLEIERGTQPLCGVYRKTCAPAVRRSLERGERRMVDFHAPRPGEPALRIGTLAARELVPPSAGLDFQPALNLNSPGELQAEALRLAAAGPAREAP